MLHKHYMDAIFRFVGWMLLGLAVFSPRTASAQCATARAAMSEARTARWLIGDDAAQQARIDTDRARLAQAMALRENEQNFHVFLDLAGAYQAMLPLDVCSNFGTRSGRLERLRGAVSAGVTHHKSGIHVRFSFLHAVDRLATDGEDMPDEDDEESATAGYRQNLYAVRVGHEQWLQGVLGFVEAESPYASEGSGGISLQAPKERAAAPGLFVGASSPMLRLSTMALLQRGNVEVLSLTAGDIRLGKLPFAFALGPTYLREERQVVGLLRLRGFAAEGYVAGESEMKRKHGIVKGVGVAGWYTGPVAELSAETRDPRLRHARLRWDAHFAQRFAAKGFGNRGAWDFSFFVDGTMFRSRFFTDPRHAPRAPARGDLHAAPARRPTAWGLAGGLASSLQVGVIAVGMQAHVGVNRPELLQLVPAAANRAEVQGLMSMRFEY